MAAFYEWHSEWKESPDALRFDKGLSEVQKLSTKLGKAEREGETLAVENRRLTQEATPATRLIDMVA